MIIIKNINTPNNTNDQTPPSRLQLLITAAQSGDRQALLQLCEDFSPLLKSEAHREMFYRSLGKDAEGIAVLALIELILKYDGADFANWPGLARCKVHFALFDAMQKQGQIWENEAQVDTDSAAGTELLEACRDADGSLDELARLLLSLDLQEALRQLNPAQRQVMMLLFAQELKPSEAAKRLGCSVRNVTKHRLKALDKLRARLDSSSYNSGHYHNERVEELTRQLRGEFDPAARSRLAVQISQQLLDDNAFIYASHLKMSFVMKSNIKGFTAHPSDYYEITSDLEV